jgi:hypothetical protein
MQHHILVRANVGMAGYEWDFDVDVRGNLHLYSYTELRPTWSAFALHSHFTFLQQSF